jgi:dTDP-4-amino-4,6-dideoxygalactose transaminase
MFIVNPNEFLLPYIGMSPFSTKHVAINHLAPEDDYSISYLKDKFCYGNWKLTANGKEAIELALKNFKLQQDDLITILTTSNNFYISSCVTKEIEKICTWNREIVPETKLIFVNHEFGYPYPYMDAIKDLGLPIIEDCCTAFFSQDRESKIGQYGDFAIYSLPKFFPLQIGGILVSNLSVAPGKSRLSAEEARYIVNALSLHLKDLEQILSKRSENYEYGSKLFAMIGFEERFSKTEKVVPYAMLLRNKDLIKDLNNFKLHMTNNGIQNSLFYGEDGFFIPNHQNLTFCEIQFMSEIVKDYVANSH